VVDFGEMRNLQGRENSTKDKVESARGEKLQGMTFRRKTKFAKK